MEYAVVLNFVILAGVAILVVGLLRAYAEVLRRLHDLDQSVVMSGAVSEGLGPVDTTIVAGADEGEPGALRNLAPAILGHRPGGSAVSLDFTGAREGTLLAFLSAGCVSCGSIWEALPDSTREIQDLGIGRVVVVTKGPKDEDPVRIRRLAGEFRDIVMATKAFRQYGVEASPYFVLVKPSGEIAGTGSAQSWEQMLGMIREATQDEAFAARLAPRHGLFAMFSRSRGRSRRRVESTAGQARRAEAELSAAGIGPGHPSLHPDRSAAKVPSA